MHCLQEISCAALLKVMVDWMIYSIETDLLTQKFMWMRSYQFDDLLLIK